MLPPPPSTKVPLGSNVEFNILDNISEWDQWRNRRRGWAGGRVPPRDSWPGNFCWRWRIGKKRGKEKGKRGENWEKKKENCEREGKKLETEVGKAIKKRWGAFFFFFFFFFFFTFENDRNLFWVYQNGYFLPGKSISRREKKSGKMTLPPQKTCLLRPWVRPWYHLAQM